MAEPSRYLKGIIWIHLFVDDSTIPDKYKFQVIEDVAKVEDELITEGIEVSRLTTIGKRLTETPLYDMPYHTLQVIAKLIFGKGVQL